MEHFNNFLIYLLIDHVNVKVIVISFYCLVVICKVKHQVHYFRS